MTNSGRIFRYLLAGAAISAVMGFSEPARAEVSVSVYLEPPPIVVAEPPEVVLIPGSQVYFVPDPQIDVFFYGGYWWSPRGDRWYRARAYNGPWGVVERRYVPRPVFGVPHDYRRVYARERHIPYGEWRGRHGRGEWQERGGESRGRGEHGGGGYGHGR